MRHVTFVVLVIMASASAASAQAFGVFEDTPPWHWAFESVQKLASAGILVGYPTADPELVENVLTQVYDAFGHAAHPAAREWAERFLVGLPSNWPQPLLRSKAQHFLLENVRVQIAGERGTASLVAAVMLRTNGGATRIRTPLRVEVQKDGEGRWRVTYASLAAGQPEVFR